MTDTSCTNTYIVLMDEDPPLPAFDRPKLSSFQFTPKSYALTITQLTNPSRQELDELAENPHATMGRRMPIKAIAPIEDTAFDRFESANPTISDLPTWGVQAVKADISSHYTGAGTTVAVLDSGIDRHHQVFRGLDLTHKNFTAIGTDTNTFDGTGHGTHAAGTVFGRSVEGQRIGVAPGVEKALIAKVLDDFGYGTTLSLIDGMQWAMSQGADVISMSLGFDFPGHIANLIADGWPPELAASRGLEDYGNNLRLFDHLMGGLQARGRIQGSSAVVIAATGNESTLDYQLGAALPSAAEGVVAVGAVQQLAPQHYSVPNFSNRNPTVVGPGVGINSALAGGGLVRHNGTSMAAPHVAGVAALWWQHLREHTRMPSTIQARHIRLKLEATASSVGLIGSRRDRGEGLVQAPQAH